jgi:hypothetical protein
VALAISDYKLLGMIRVETSQISQCPIKNTRGEIELFLATPKFVIEKICVND